jgi:hypothetical protein
MRTGSVAALAAAVLLALGAGMWLGGHPAGLPQPLRDLFVDETTSVQAEATDVIRDNYYRSVTERRLRDGSLRGMVRSLRNRFSHYFTPEEYRLFRESASRSVCRPSTARCGGRTAAGWEWWSWRRSAAVRTVS